MGYTLEEVQGKHHSIFVRPEYKESDDYKTFLGRVLTVANLKQESLSESVKKANEVWIQASYNPILDLNGKPYKVVKFATDVTEQKLQNANFSGQIEAINKAQAVIEFNMDGTIITANENFLATVGYSLDRNTRPAS